MQRRMRRLGPFEGRDRHLGSGQSRLDIHFPTPRFLAAQRTPGEIEGSIHIGELNSEGVAGLGPQQTPNGQLRLAGNIRKGRSPGKRQFRISKRGRAGDCDSLALKGHGSRHVPKLVALPGAGPEASGRERRGSEHTLQLPDARTDARLTRDIHDDTNSCRPGQRVNAKWQAACTLDLHPKRDEIGERSVQGRRDPKRRRFRTRGREHCVIDQDGPRRVFP